MAEKPILFSSDMVKAILDGRKTQTRRVLRANEIGKCPYGKAGDTLWVRETWATYPGSDLDKIKPSELHEKSVIYYRASDVTPSKHKWFKWRPSIFMPRWASRITLKVTGVRVERLQDISEDDARAEGARRATWYQPTNDEKDDRTLSESWSLFPSCYRNGFANLWNSINAKRGYSWAINPWVWVIEFEVKNAK